MSDAKSRERAKVRVIGGGLAGCEAAWQLAERGLNVELFEMKPNKRSPAHKLDGLAELVCSNSFGSDKPGTASALLKAEMQLLGSLILACAKKHTVPAGSALAIERVGFSKEVTQAIEGHPRIELRREEAVALDAEVPSIVATGPLTSQAMAKSIAELLGERFLYFYDAISPTVEMESLDMTPLFWGSRYEQDGEDYLNVPLSKEQYLELIEDLKLAEKVPLHPFEEPKYFEGCLPMDVQAARGELTLAHGALKPVGLVDPATGRRPYAVIQLRRENHPTTMLSMVGCQNKLKWPEQRRIFCKLPGFAEAQFVRMGSIHRNTYIHSPSLLSDDLSLRRCRNLFFAGQLIGVEGYVESTAMGLLAGIYLGHRQLGRQLRPIPRQTMLGSLVDYVLGGGMALKEFQPMNANFALLPKQESSHRGRRGRQARRAEQVERSLNTLSKFVAEHDLMRQEETFTILKDTANKIDNLPYPTLL